ncbi:MAG TPA: Na-translocating system protein MpsC family protein [Solirubrobacterales bacterium]|nr:Na-translocating system protein MpsC family protein [Solirubrobacterales bacterium]
MTEQPATTQGESRDGSGYESIRAEISREMVRLYKDLFGRGPTKARTEFAGPDIVICTLENTFTPAERSLAEMGEHQRLRDTRMYFQSATADKFREIIERLTGRKVRAFISGLDAGVDVCCEVFYLEDGRPDGG